MNRDERYDRPVELAPDTLNQSQNVRGPVDSLSGGTWIAYNEQGYWGCLLNGYLDQDKTHRALGTKSRGGILPEILGTGEPFESAKSLDKSMFPSFRLIIGNADEVKLLEWDGTEEKTGEFHASYDERAWFLSSSSWNQSEVIGVRRQLFLDWCRDNPLPALKAPDYHLSCEPTSDSAPLMMRQHSGTRSLTSLNVSGHAVKVDYLPVPHGVAAADPKTRAIA